MTPAGAPRPSAPRAGSPGGMPQSPAQPRRAQGPWGVLHRGVPHGAPGGSGHPHGGVSWTPSLRGPDRGLNDPGGVIWPPGVIWPSMSDAPPPHLTDPRYRPKKWSQNPYPTCFPTCHSRGDQNLTPEIQISPGTPTGSSLQGARPGLNGAALRGAKAAPLGATRAGEAFWRGAGQAKCAVGMRAGA